MNRAAEFVVLIVCLLLAGNVHASRINPNQTYSRFQLGVTGAWATVEKDLAVTIDSVDAGTPADGVLQKGDIVLAANGHKMEGEDVRVPLGTAIGDAESKEGKLNLRIKRDGKEQNVTVTVPVLGPYSKTWPIDCGKSKKIIQQTAEFLAKSQQEDGSYMIGNRKVRDGLDGCLMGLFLLSTGDDKYLPNVQLQCRNLSEKAVENPTGSMWHLGYQGILLGEYYLRTGDKKVLPALDALCKQAARNQHAGAWYHGTGGNPGYVQSGLMNSAGVTVFTALALARECGVASAEEPFRKSLKFFYRMMGHGCICYGDHRSELFPNTNGRSAAAACTVALLGGDAYQAAARHLARVLTDSYYAHEFGHTGGGFNVIWRGTAAVHVLPEGEKDYRRNMDKLAWYYDLCRLPGGGFSMLPTPPSTTRYCGPTWGTGAVGLTYTAPLNKLRINGGPKTEHSATTPKLPEIPWGNKNDLAFFRFDCAEGYGPDDSEPYEMYKLLFERDGQPTVDYCASKMRHYSPMVRTWAARKLAEKADEASVDAIVDGLKHTDPRVRRAACDGISGYDNWGRGRPRGRITPEDVSEKCLPHIEKILGDPDSAWWEIDGALWALGRAKPEDIRRNMPIIRKFAKHEEWYLREAAFWAVVGLGKEITDEEFLFLADMYKKSRHVFARSSYNGGINVLVRNHKIDLKPETLEKSMEKLGYTLHSALIVEDYGEPAVHEATHRTMMVLSNFKDPVLYKVMLHDFIKYLDNWSPDFQHSHWMIVGSPWQVGLVKVAEDLGPDAGPLVDAFRRCLKKIDTEKPSKAAIECREKLEKAIADYDKKYGKK